jgi:hypothetical protein
MKSAGEKKKPALEAGFLQAKTLDRGVRRGDASAKPR